MQNTKRWSLLGLLLVAIVMLFAIQNTQAATSMNESDVGKVADAIYKIEGGAKAKVPYGILSVKVSSEKEARKVCENTIRNNYKRWQSSNTHSNYFDFLADKYCPPSADRQGNLHWKKNIQSMLGKDFVKRYQRPALPTGVRLGAN